MFAAERQHRILQRLQSHGVASLRELAELTESSEVTVRRDLSALEAEGLLTRRRGGALLGSGTHHEQPYEQKSGVAAEEKGAIADLAVTLVQPGDAIVIGAGSTTQALARRLVALRDLTVVTNSLLVAEALSSAEGVEVVVTGGTLRGSIHALVGSAAEASLGTLRTGRAFLSGNGLTAERGLTTPSLAVASIDRALAAAASEVVVLADHTKIGQDTMCQTVGVEAISRVITDAGADAGAVAALRAAGAQVQLVQHPASAATRSSAAVPLRPRSRP